MVGCFLYPLGSKLAYATELEAIIYPLDFTKLRGWPYVWLECDWSYAVNLLKAYSYDILGFVMLDGLPASVLFLLSILGD